MASNQTQRPQFYEGQYLGAEDLQALTEYYRTGDARHALGAHTWGIASGLYLIDKEIPGGVETYLTPGYGWDGLGRPIVVLAPYKIPAELFKSIGYNATIDDPKGRLVKVWLRHDEIKAQRPAPGFETCDSDGFSRVQETFRVEIGEHSVSERQINVSVGAVSALAQEIPEKLGTKPPLLYDESIPFQQFPQEGPAVRWLISVGQVRWKPNANPLFPGAFVKREPDDLTSSRRLRWSIGVVAETIRPVEDIVRIRRRGQDPAPKRWSDDLAWVEGDLRIDGKLNLCDPSLGNLKWQVDGTTANLTIGEANSAGQPDARVVVKVGGNVGIGTTNPVGRLTLNGIVQPAQGALTLFSQSADFEYDGGDDKLFIFKDSAGGSTAFLGGNVGIGVSKPTGRLTLEGAFQPQQGQLSFFTNAADMVYDGGSDKLFIFQNTNADGKTAFLGGNVGIGTTSPTEKLEVAGNLKVSGLINGHDLDAELQTLGGVKDVVTVVGEIADGANIWFETGTGKPFEDRFISLKKITLPAPLPGAGYEIECSYVPIQGLILPGQVRGRVTVKCQQKWAGLVLAETSGTASYLVVGYDK